MLQPNLLPGLLEVLESIRQKRRIEDVVGLILEKACGLAHAAHGSFVLVDHTARRLTIANVYGSDWTLEHRLCQLAIGQGLTGKVAASGRPMLCRDTVCDPDYYPLFDYVRSELVVPVIVSNRVWGVINIDGRAPGAFDDHTLELLTIFAELTASAITMRLEMAEQRKVYQKLLQSEKLASLGEALAGIAHEINNPLTAILGYAYLLDQEQDPAALRNSTAIITAEAQRAADLIRGLLEFSRKETGRRELVFIGDVIAQVVALKKYQLKMNNVKLLISHEGDPCPVSVCPQQIKQVLLNLITNSEQAFGSNRKDCVVDIAVKRSASHVVLQVSDNGMGIPSSVTNQIFDPFFTTKPPGQGTGLGLSIAHSIMEAHGGTIALAHSSPAGTTFTLTLPLAIPVLSEIVPIDALPATGSTPEMLSGRILLVDDEPAILDSVAAYLTMRQISVQRAGSAEAALQLLQHETYEAVVSDIRMPGMDGIKLYYATCRLNPVYERRFVFMSGYFMRDSVQSFLSSTELPCLEKPFPFDELCRALAPLLNGSEPLATDLGEPSRVG